MHANPYKLFLKARKSKSKSHHHHPRKEHKPAAQQPQPSTTTTTTEEKIMYHGGGSPVFDVPEFPTLRRVKPLPKRRKTSPTASSDPTSNNANAAALDMINPDATAEELLAHAETLSARMALQSYYVPILGGVQDFLAGAAAAAKPGAGGASPNLDSLEFGVHLAAAAAAAAGLGLGGRGGGDEDDEHGDGDYIDHLQQPGNTKKRKVPVNVGNSPRGGGVDGEEVGAGGGGGREEMDRGIPTGRTEGGGGGGGSESAMEAYRPTAGQLGLLGQKRGKLAAVTLAGLQHKEMLKSRKRQLAAVLGALSHGDTLALDQALSANYPFVPGGRFDDVKNVEMPRVRLSKRTTVRLARAMRIKRIPRHPDAVPLPASEFTFVCPSATADRLIATKEEVTMLRNRFEEELERQAAKAVKLAAASRMMNSLTSKGRSKRERAQQRARTITNGKPPSVEQTAEFLDQALIGGTKPRGKKKKRSALANASNPHHLRNYVPSRLPHSGGGVGAANGTSQANPNDLGPLPLRFLSAEIPPRRRKKSQAPQPTAQLTNPADEWICAFCEYALFYGDEQEYRRAVRNRKKILRRRRRARERAAAAAAGGNSAAPKVPEKSGSDGYEGSGGGFDPSPDEFANVPKQTKWKGDPNKDKERSLAGEQASYG